MKKFYIAFSIHGSNAFVTANIETKDFGLTQDEQTVIIGGREFQKVKSRRPDYDPEKDGQKLQSAELKTQEGKPLRSPPMILRFFNQLEAEGWTVDKEAFVKKHWKK